MTTAHISTTPAPLSVPATRTSADSLKSLPHALRSEWIKISTLRSNKAIVALAMAANGFISYAITSWATDDVTGRAIGVFESFTFASMFTAVFATVGAILLFTSEAQHGTLAGAITAQPSRWVVAGAKTIAAAGYGAALGAVGLAAGVAGGLLSGADLGSTKGLLPTIGMAVGFTVLAGVLGLGIGMITRHGAAAISGVLVWWLIVENLLMTFLDQQVARFLPFAAGNNMIGITMIDPASDLSFSWLVNTAIFAGYAVAAVSIGTFLLHRRDPS